MITPRAGALRLLVRVAAVSAVLLTGGGTFAAQPPETASTISVLRTDADRLTKAGEWTALLAVLTRLGAAAAATGDLTMQAETLHRTGLAHRQLKAPARAREAFEAALAIHVERDDRLNAGVLREALGLLAWSLGDAAGVRAHFAAAADDFEAAGDVAKQVTSLRNVTFAADMGLDERVAILERARALAAGLDDTRVQGRLRHQLGDVLTLRGDYDLAIDELEASIAIFESAGDESGLALALTSLGRTFRLHGLPERALVFYERVLALAAKDGNQRTLAQTHDAIGVALWNADRRTEAVTAGRRAVGIARDAGLEDSVAFHSNNLASYLAESGAHAEAVSLLEPLLATARGPIFEKSARQSLARAYHGLGRLADARTEVDAAVVACEAAEDRELLVTALGLRAQIRLDLADASGALVDTRGALDVLESLRTQAARRDEMKQSFVDRHRELFAFAVALQRDGGDAAGAFDTAERARARAFLDLLATRARAPVAAQAGGISQAIPSTVAVPPAQAAAVRDTVRALGTTLLAYWVAPEETTIWVMTPAGDLHAARVRVDAGRFEALTQQIWSTATTISTATVRGAIELPARSGTHLAIGAHPRGALAELYQFLIAPVAAHLPTAEGSLLTIVPHGPLFSVPFAALTDPRGRYLVERHRLHALPSAALLAPAAPMTRDGGVLLVADPDPMPAHAGATLARLPGARAEVRAVAALLPGGVVTALEGSAASLPRVRAAVSTQRVLHFATHGLIFDDRPFDSFLALSTGPTGEDAGRLTTGDIYGLRLDADLVVLSACRTGTGTLTGDGVQGLARAFLYAGTPSVVATLWDLPDEAAQHMFPAFYRRYLADGNRSGALRDAQLSFLRALRNGRISVSTPVGDVRLPEHPALWAGVVLLGQP